MLESGRYTKIFGQVCKVALWVWHKDTHGDEARGAMWVMCYWLFRRLENVEDMKQRAMDHAISVSLAVHD